MPRRSARKSKLPTEPQTVEIEGLSHEGRGVGHIEGKTVFVDGALPGETVEMRYTFQRGKFDEGRLHQLLVASKDRVEPVCEYFAACGGCSMQHLSRDKQILHKQSILKEQLAHIADVEPQTWLPPVLGDSQGYRRKARLGVRYVNKKNRALVGFREKYSHYIADIDNCKVLHKPISDLIKPLGDLIATLDIKTAIPQIEVSCGDEDCAFIVRHLLPVSQSDRLKWIDFARQFNIQLYFQAKGPNSIIQVWPQQQQQRQELFYYLPEFDLKFAHQPLDFIQVNNSVNQKMIALALQLLAVNQQEQVLDLFCGLGNFSLPLATRAKYVVGVEGNQAMVEQAKTNAKLNQLDNLEFHCADLTTDLSDQPWITRQFDKILIDPARSGALQVIENIVNFNARKLVYVSCNPATLARDSKRLIDCGYSLRKAGVLDMFSHTAHVESIALFEKTN